MDKSTRVCFKALSDDMCLPVIGKVLFYGAAWVSMVVMLAGCGPRTHYPVANPYMAPAGSVPS